MTEFIAYVFLYPNRVPLKGALEVLEPDGGCGRCGLTADPNLTAMGIESFFVCSLLILRDLQESVTSENRS